VHDLRMRVGKAAAVEIGGAPVVASASRVLGRLSALQLSWPSASQARADGGYGMWHASKLGLRRGTRMRYSWAVPFFFCASGIWDWQVARTGALYMRRFASRTEQTFETNLKLIIDPG
jgi:hypothetical protein